MPRWEKQLENLVQHRSSERTGNKIVQAVHPAVVTFAKRLSELGRTIEFNETENAQIGLRVLHRGSIEMDLQIRFHQDATISLFSHNAVISNFRLKEELVKDEKEVVQFLLYLYGAAI